MLTVVGAIIVNDGKVLICQRSRTDSFPLKWEFPGGKVEAGETHARALAREIMEELGGDNWRGIPAGAPQIPREERPYRDNFPLGHD